MNFWALVHHMMMYLQFASTKYSFFLAACLAVVNSCFFNN